MDVRSRALISGFTPAFGGRALAKSLLIGTDGNRAIVRRTACRLSYYHADGMRATRASNAFDPHKTERPQILGDRDPAHCSVYPFRLAYGPLQTDRKRRRTENPDRLLSL